jgi:phosphatidylglycerol:prolipoprotein diacylglycerol transferase
VHPILFHSGHLFLPTFGFLAAAGLMLALALSQRTAPLCYLSPDALWDAGLFAVLSAFVLSRLLLIVQNLGTFVHFPLLLLAVPSLTPWGLILTVAATFAWLHFKRISVPHALDAWAPCATLVWAFLAFGHFEEGSDPGMPTHSPFSVHMPGGPPREQPVALYAAAFALLLTFVLLWLLSRPHRPLRPTAFALIGTGFAQFLLTFLRAPGAQAVLGLDVLQLVSLGLIFAGAMLQPTRTASTDPIP